MLYDEIGKHYAARRVPDPRIASHIHRALEGCESIVNVGAGAGSYEPNDRPVVAVEPSMTMIRQRPAGSAPAIQAVAEQLPLRDQCAAAATAFLTMHHWTNLAQGLAELGRVARDRVAILTWDIDEPAFWLTEEYFPEIPARDRQTFPAISGIARVLGPVSVDPVPIPHDCIDGFLGAYWRRPHAYLDPAMRSGISGFRDLSGLDEGLSRLAADLASGDWNRKFGHLLARDSLDLGYRLVVAELQ
jgi:SAM-dependent methyltransferase